MWKYILTGLFGITVLLFCIMMSHMMYRNGPVMKYNANMEKVEIRGYSLAPSDDAGSSGAKEEEPPFEFDVALATLTPELGEKKFKKCASCHTVDQGGKDKVGPNLFNIVNGAKAGSGSFAYSDALKSIGGTWTEKELFDFLKSPKTFAKGTKMSFAGFKKDKDAAAVVVYLRTLK